MSKSSSSASVRKPREDFPLFPHASGRWCKKIRQRLVYFGKTSDDPNGERALAKWEDEREDLLAGRVPHRGSPEEFLVRDLANQFLTVKTEAAEAGTIAARTLHDYHHACGRMVKCFGRLRLGSDIKPDDFAKLRSMLATTLGPVTLANEIQRVRTIFKWAADEGKLTTAVVFGQSFKKPPKREMRLQRAEKRTKHGVRMLLRDELQAVLKIANPQMKAMILLGANGGLGAADIATLPIKAFDLDSGWLDFPRAKTGVDRRFPLWPETLDAVKTAIDERVAAVKPEDDDLAFLTCFGHRWVEVKSQSKRPHDALGSEFNKLLVKAGVKRAGVRFYALRHGFQSIGDETLDFVAVRAVMGHADGSISANYREFIDDARLRRVVDHVRTWLFGADSKPTKKSSAKSA